MNMHVLESFLLWCFLLNAGFLLLWFLMFAFARDWIYRVHGRWFRLSDEAFDTVHYAAMAFLKVIITAFFLLPYLALRIAG